MKNLPYNHNTHEALCTVHGTLYDTTLSVRNTAVQPSQRTVCCTTMPGVPSQWLKSFVSATAHTAETLPGRLHRKLQQFPGIPFAFPGTGYSYSTPAAAGTSVGWVFVCVRRHNTDNIVQAEATVYCMAPQNAIHCLALQPLDLRIHTCIQAC